MKKIIFSLLFVSALINTSCSNDDEHDETNAGGQATMTITIEGQSGLRYVGPSLPNPAVEGLVSNLTVMVFNYFTGDLEKYQNFTVSPGEYTKQVTGLSTGTEKRVVAFVNVPTSLDVSGITTYAQLNTNSLTLDSQNATDLSTTGLFMSGQTTDPITLSTTGTNPVNIPVSRRVAKVILSGLSIAPDVAGDLPLFTLGGVSIQKARLTTTPIGNRLAPEGEDPLNYAGGIASPAGATPNFNLTRSFLLDSIPYPAGYTSGTPLINDNSQRYFYVLPNDGVNNHATLLTVFGTFGSTPVNAYYPFEINSTSGVGNTDGNYIESNKIYSVSVVLRRVNLPSEDPNLVPSEVVMDVTITPQDWIITINQPVEW